jgi:hypothetical protein
MKKLVRRTVTRGEHFTINEVLKRLKFLQTCIVDYGHGMTTVFIMEEITYLENFLYNRKSGVINNGTETNNRYRLKEKRTFSNDRK